MVAISANDLFAGYINAARGNRGLILDPTDENTSANLLLAQSVLDHTTEDGRDERSRQLQNGVDSRLTTLRLMIQAGDLTHTNEAKGLIKQHGDIAYPYRGDKEPNSRTALLNEAIEDGEKTAKIKEEIRTKQG